MAKDNKTRKPFKKAEKEFDQRIVDLARVTRVMAGGKRMRFRASVAIGDHKGRCGFGVAKGADVTIAINKAVNKAKKAMIKVPIINETIPHRLLIKRGAAKILLNPAPRGTGVKAGGAVRIVLELAGVPNITAKILGTNNKMNNVKALMVAFSQFKYVPKKNKSEKPEIKKTVKAKENKEIKKTVAKDKKVKK